jgi:salicylate hydroxylase
MSFNLAFEQPVHIISAGWICAMNIIIFGAGIAGLMTAITLSAHGHHCKIYERCRENLDGGMGMIIHPACLNHFTQFGINLSHHMAGSDLSQYRYRNINGDILHEQIMHTGTLGICRRHLIDILVNALPSSHTVVLDSALQTLEFNTAGQITSAYLSTGECVMADLYIAADGAHSQARHALFPGWPMPTARTLEMVGLVDDDQTAQWAAGALNKFHAGNGGIAFGILPVGESQVVWYLQFDELRFSQPASNTQAKRVFVQDLVGHWAYPISRLIAASDFSKVHTWRPIDSDLIPSFYRNNLVLIGDAAHPFLPFTSQGISSAIADAVTLSEALETDCLRNALDSYSFLRRTQCTRHITQGRNLARRFLAPQSIYSDMLPFAK